jgi:SWIRM domain
VDIYYKAKQARVRLPSIQKRTSANPGAQDIEFSQHADKALKRSASQAGLDRKGKGSWLAALISRCADLPAAPLTLGTAPSLNLLTPDEQLLCSQLRLLPRAYLAIKATIIREYQRRGGELSRKQAKELLKCDVYKTARVYDLLIVMGLLNPPPETVEMPMVPPVPTSVLTNGITNGYGEK